MSKVDVSGGADILITIKSSLTPIFLRPLSDRLIH